MNRRRGATFLEIVIAVFIMAIVLIPVGTLIFGGIRGSEQSRRFATGAAFACDVMDRLLSHRVPFDAIVPGTGPPVEGGFRPGLKQAGFRREHGDLEALVGGEERVLVRAGVRYEVFLFAGLYEDRSPGHAEMEKELTFCHLANPSVSRTPQSTRSVVLESQDPAVFPYLARPDATVTDANGNEIAVTDAGDARFRAGWPRPQDEQTWLPSFEDALKHDPTKGRATGDFALRLSDLSAHDEARGSLLKLVLGLRWAHGGTSGGGGGDPRKTHEFWLVSLKARAKETLR